MGPKRLEYIMEPGFPCLGWVLCWRRGAPHVVIIHGDRVETRPDFFWEGAWGGAFEHGDFHCSALALGSGGRLSAGRLVVASASHSLERLQSVRSGDRLTISNSLPLLLSFNRLDLDPAHALYDIGLMAFLDGLPSVVCSIPTRQGHEIMVHHCSNLIVSDDLAVEQEEKPGFPNELLNYGAYVDFLTDLSAELTTNAADPARRHAYRPLATVSSGYDSPACAVLARSVGAVDAVTFATSRADFAGGSDSGRMIGERLGLRTHEFDRDDYLGREDHPEAEFLATGTGGEDVVMSVLESVLPGMVLFTGFLGDTVWGLIGPTEPSTRYRMTYPAGASLQEFRLRVGFVHFPVPQSHQRLHPRVRAISRLPEMAPWRRGGGYDRPIPRRMAEDSGVPGDWFGAAKKAITQPFYHGEDLDRVLSPRSAESFRAFCFGRGLLPRPPSLLASKPMRSAVAMARRASWRLPRHRVASWRLLRSFEVSEHPYLVHWATDLMQRRYGRMNAASIDP
jgi:hypothetical protein